MHTCHLLRWREPPSHRHWQENIIEDVELPHPKQTICYDERSAQTSTKTQNPHKFAKQRLFWAISTTQNLFACTSIIYCDVRQVTSCFLRYHGAEFNLWAYQLCFAKINCLFDCTPLLPILALIKILVYNDLKLFQSIEPSMLYLYLSSTRQITLCLQWYIPWYSYVSLLVLQNEIISQSTKLAEVIDINMYIFTCKVSISLLCILLLSQHHFRLVQTKIFECDHRTDFMSLHTLLRERDSIAKHTIFRMPSVTVSTRICSLHKSKPTTVSTVYNSCNKNSHLQMILKRLDSATLIAACR